MPQLHVKQRSSEWFEARKGMLTASNFRRVMSTNPNTWKRLRLELNNGSTFAGNKYTDWGHEYEEEARHVFELFRNISVSEVGFITHPDLDYVGCSPDGLVFDDVGIEIKCPYSQHNHERFLDKLEVPPKYMPQVQGGLWVTGRRLWYFMSYDPRQEVSKQLAWVEVQRDEEYIAVLEKRVKAFIDWWKHDKPLVNCL